MDAIIKFYEANQDGFFVTIFVLVLLRIPFNLIYIKHKYDFDLNKLFDFEDDIEEKLVLITALFAVRWINMPEKAKIYGLINNGLSSLCILLIIFSITCHMNLPVYYKVKP